MHTLEEAIDSTARTGNKPLMRVAVVEGPGFALKAGVTDLGDGHGWVPDGTWEFDVGAITFKEDTADNAVAAALKYFKAIS